MRAHSRVIQVLGVLGLMMSWAPAQAQRTLSLPPLTPTKNTERTVTSLQLRHIEPALMAWWLDPERNPAPLATVRGLTPETQVAHLSAQYRQFLQRQLQVGSPGIVPGTEQRVKTPRGVDTLVPLNDRKLLLVIGTEDGGEQVRTIVSFLDKPIRRIALRTRIVALHSEDIAKVVESPGGHTNQSIWASQLKQDAFTDLTKQNKIRVLSETEILTPNNSAATAYSCPSLALTMMPQGSNKSASRAVLNLRPSLEITPTINNDNTITLSLEHAVYGGWSLQAPASATPLLLQTSGESLLQGQSVETVAMARPDDTIALVGLSARQVTSAARETYWLSTRELEQLGNINGLGKPEPVVVLFSVRLVDTKPEAAVGIDPAVPAS